MNTIKATAIVFASAAILSACGTGASDNKQTTDTATAAPANLMAAADSNDTCASDIPVDSANKMIGSYIQSLGGNPSNENLYSLIADANCLRNYLNAHPEVTNVKLMFAHTLDYINTGHQGQNAGYKSGALTLVIAGYDAAGNYVLINGNRVMDRVAPCPIDCPQTGTAASNTLPAN
ncbi:hypothetical protein CAP35_12680 [Chitinophagaceae bacterium IBVUCB1]|nr:hypothetical protein CAP35_12680 [Chitinophagaceae bacterium IBVUCB1]